VDHGDVLLGTSAQEDAWELMWVRMSQSECAFAHRSSMDLADLAGSPEPDLSWLASATDIPSAVLTKVIRTLQLKHHETDCQSLAHCSFRRNIAGPARQLRARFRFI
jgi:hypothetical protein